MVSVLGGLLLLAAAILILYKVGILYLIFCSYQGHPTTGFGEVSVQWRVVRHRFSASIRSKSTLGFS